MKVLKHSFTIILLVILLQGQTTSAARTRIVGGEPTVVDGETTNFPWMVTIIKTDKLPNIEQQCGGTLIHPEWVLTAAHCILSKTEPTETTESINIFAGHHDLKSGEGKILAITKIVIHPDYNGDDYLPTADIALLKLKEPYQQKFLRVTANYTNLDMLGKDAVVMGWGATDPQNIRTSYSSILLKATVPIVSNEVCNKYYNNEITNRMLCAGYEEGKIDACGGDSGGPLVVSTNDSWQQIGIVSFGNGCAQPNSYGVYTRVSAFEEFINQYVCQDTSPLPQPNIQVNVVNNNEVSITWDALENVEGYQLYYTPYVPTIEDIELNDIHSLDVNGQTQFNAHLRKNESYYVAVRAYQGNCWGDYSNIEAVK